MIIDPKLIVEASTIDYFYLPGVKFAMVDDKVYILALPKEGRDNVWKHYNADYMPRTISIEEVKTQLRLLYYFDKVLETL